MGVELELDTKEAERKLAKFRSQLEEVRADVEALKKAYTEFLDRFRPGWLRRLVAWIW